MTISEKLIASCIFMIAICLMSVRDVDLNLLIAAFVLSYGTIAAGCDLRKAYDSWREQRGLKKTAQSKALINLAEEVRRYYESDIDMVGDFSSDLYKAYEAYKKAIGDKKAHV